MKSQAMITKESNDDFRQRLNISTIDSEIQVRRLSILHRAANNPEQSKQLKIALLGTRHDTPNHTKHRKQGSHATIVHDLLQLIPSDPHLQYIRNQLAGEGVSDSAWQYLATLNKSTITKLRTTKSTQQRIQVPRREATLTCSVCGATAESNAGLAAHKLRAHNQGNKYRQAITNTQCIHCKKHLKNTYTAKQHFTRVRVPKLTEQQKTELLARHHPANTRLQRAFAAGAH